MGTQRNIEHDQCFRCGRQKSDGYYRNKIMITLNDQGGHQLIGTMKREWIAYEPT